MATTTPTKRKTRPDVHFRIERAQFDRLRDIAEADSRPLANMVEKIVMEWLRKVPHEAAVGSRLPASK